MTTPNTKADPNVTEFDATAPDVMALMGAMSLGDKIGQMSLAQPGEGHPVEALGDLVRTGKIGAIINVVDPVAVAELQRIALEESPYGIPLLVGRDVIHGFKTIMPIPLGQAASWNPELVRMASTSAAAEASLTGVNWTYAPMMDISRDPRWGRIAESFGEDVFLTCQMSKAMVEGFQWEGLSAPASVAACAKHFVGYGAAESGRDYATTNISEHELHNVYLPPFKAAVDSGVASVMTSFSDLDGIPATAHRPLLTDLLRDQWGFGGIVVSDWNSIPELTTHGLTADDQGAAIAAAHAGVDLEMASDTYLSHLASAVEDGKVPMEVIDHAVARLLKLKVEMGLFSAPCPNIEAEPSNIKKRALEHAYQSALESMVLLKNEHHTLPLKKEQIKKVAVIGPLADGAYEQLGTWIFDGDPDISISAWAGLQNKVGGDLELVFEPALETSRSRDMTGIQRAVEVASQADVVLLFLGEEAILSGEAHSRADIDLPGAQVDLVKSLHAVGKPVVGVIMAGRPLTLSNVMDQLDALVYAWHPGTMGGAAIADLLFGDAVPSGKLPVTFPRVVGQIPLYYNAKNTGKPPTPELVTYIDDIPVRAPQTSLGMSAFHLDVAHTPLFCFGYGLSYTQFSYSNLRLSRPKIQAGEHVDVHVDLTNTGDRSGTEVVQLYVRDPVASITRPVRELKGFQRITLAAGETRQVSFTLHTDALKFYCSGRGWILEPGLFEVWVGGDSNATLHATFDLGDE